MKKLTIKKVGDTVMSTKSWSNIVIASIDMKNQYFIGVDGRAVHFNDVNGLNS